MKYWCISYPDEILGDVVETLSEYDILQQYYPYWSSKMIEKYGQEEFDANWCRKDCIDDWVVVHWAWPSDS